MKKEKWKRRMAGVMACLMAFLLLPWSDFVGVVPVQAAEQEDTTYSYIPDAAQTIAAGDTAIVEDYFTIHASLDKIAIESNSKKLNGVTYGYRMKMSKTGSKTDQNVSFTTTKAYAIVTVYAISGSSTDSQRALTLEGTDVVDRYYVDGSSLKAYTYYVSGADTFYLYSENSGINIYGIEVTETNMQPTLTVPEITAVASGSTSVISWKKVAGATSYELYSSADSYTTAVKTVEAVDLQTDYQAEYSEAASGTYSYQVKAVSNTFVDASSAVSEEITVDADSLGVTSLDESVWSTAKLGTQSDKMNTPSYNALTNTLSLSTGGNGKMANTGQSGFSVFYTKVNSNDYNFTIRGRFHVTDVSKQDNQSSFGLIVMDTLGADDTTADYINQLDLYAATKSEATGTCIPGIRTYTGNDDSTGKTNSSGTCDVTKYFDADTTVFTESNATELYYNFEIVKNSNGYVCNWYNDNWSEITGTIELYNPDRFLQQEEDNVYVGFYASRIGDVEVTDISYEQHTPTAEEVAEIDKGLWLDYDTVNVKTFNGETTSDSDYKYRFTSNVTGTVSVSDSEGRTYITDQEISNGDMISFQLSDYGYELSEGTTTFTTRVTPYANAADAEGVIQYEDRLLLQDYSTVMVDNTVTRRSIGQDDPTLYVAVDGTTNGDGTQEHPYDLYTAVSYASAGQTIVLEDGTYALGSVLSIPYSASGTEEAPITLKAANTGRAILDGAQIPDSSDSVVFLKGDYWNLYGISVCNSSDGTKGIHVAGNHNTIEMCEMYRNGSTGLQISYSGGEPKTWWPSDNTIKNCTSYYNCDSKQNDADGFAAKLSVGSGNVFDGCISYNNADDGYDLYAKDKTGYGPIEPVTIKNSLAYNNGILEDGSYSAASANGFKLGGEGLTGKHVLENCVSWHNGGSGIMSNNGPDCQVYNCTSVDNGLFSRVDKTEARNNYQLTPKNGTSYLGSTGYVVENAISFYTDQITDFGTMVADKFTLINQDSSVVYKANNYLCTDITTGLCENTEQTIVTADWFESTDYANITPTRNTDGTIDMHGLFVLTAQDPEGIGAVITAKSEDTNGASGDADDSTVSGDVAADDSTVSGDVAADDSTVSGDVAADDNAVIGDVAVDTTTTEIEDTMGATETESQVVDTTETEAETTTVDTTTVESSVATGDRSDFWIYVILLFITTVIASGVGVLGINKHRDTNREKY